eukprot:6988757-Pyramimonas_sp.AAC.1
MMTQSHAALQIHSLPVAMIRSAHQVVEVCAMQVRLGDAPWETADEEGRRVREKAASLKMLWEERYGEVFEHVQRGEAIYPPSEAPNFLVLRSAICRPAVLNLLRHHVFVPPYHSLP